MRRRTVKGERITENTLIRVAIDLLLAHQQHLAGGSETEIRLPGRFKVTPQVAGAIKSVPGVLQVEAA